MRGASSACRRRRVEEIEGPHSVACCHGLPTYSMSPATSSMSEEVDMAVPGGTRRVGRERPEDIMLRLLYWPLRLLMAVGGFFGHTHR